MGLLTVITGKLIKTVTINRPNLRWPFPKGMKERLEGNVVLNVNRRSKYILVWFHGHLKIIFANY